MKVNAAPSFFESLKRIGSFKDKWLTFKGWIKYHLFNKNFYALLKEVYKTYPWDSCFLYDLEKAKIEEMRKYHIKSDRFVGVEYVIRDMKICENLIDIFTGKRDLGHYDGELTYTKLEDGNYEIGHTPDFKYVCNVKVNTKNLKRFVKDPKIEKFYTEHPDELYMLKAKHLYHKIRYENDSAWWD